MKRCEWVNLDNQLYVDYHDREWGVPVRNDTKLFEFMVLESAQAGLSWLTVLKKREGYRRAFYDFNPASVAELTDTDVERLVQDASIIRNRAKIRAAINNAQCFMQVQSEFGSFSNYMWAWVENTPIQNNRLTLSEVPATTELAERMAKDLKKRGFKFLGATVWYAHMQAVGMVNDHTSDCFRHSELSAKHRPG